MRCDAIDNALGGSKIAKLIMPGANDNKPVHALSHEGSRENAS